MKLDEHVNKHYKTLSENDLLIWEYIKNNRESCRNMSVSSTSILRFCKKLEMDGYSELKVALKWQEQGGDIVATNLLNRTYQDYYLTLDYLKEVDLQKVFELFDCSETRFCH